MRGYFKKTIAVIMVVVMTLTAAPLSGFVGIDAKAETSSSLEKGEVIEFGSYPQSKVVDSKTISSLNTLDLDWVSYNYYSGTGSWDDGKMSPGDWAKYADVTYEDCKYRAVKFTQYRPYYTGEQFYTESESYQADHGYYVNTVYWFKYEPLKWLVIDPEDGLVLCESMIDNQAYNNVVFETLSSEGIKISYNSTEATNYACDYEASSIRIWLNNDFYNTAFTSVEKTIIKTTTLNNSGVYVPMLNGAAYNGAETEDKVFLLSHKELAEKYYEPTDRLSRCATGTDYAKSQGLYVYNNYSNYWTRTAGVNQDFSSVCHVSYDGYIEGYRHPTQTLGIRPAMKISQGIAVFSTEKSFTVKTGEKMSLAFGYVNGTELDGEWKKMAITVSDPTVVSLSDYKKTDYGYMIDVVGKKEGVTNLTVTDTETGVNTVITVTVSDKYTKTYSYAVDNMPSFYPNNKYENNIQTNIYNLNGLYVNNYSYTKVGDKYKVSFNAYNELYHQAAVDIYDADGNWFSSKKIDKYTEMTSVFDTGEQVYYLFANLEWASYIHPMHTKLTEIEFEIPDGGYFTISNNFAESPGCFFYNAFDILYQGVSAMIDVVTENVETPIHDFFMDKITEDKTTREQFMELFIRSVDKEVRQYTGNILDGMVENSYAGLSGLLENMFVSLGLDWKHLLSSATGIAVSALGKISGPLGLAFEACYVIPEGTNKLLQGLDIGWSVDEPYMCVYTDVGSGYLNPHGVYVDTNGNTDEETVLQVFRISNDDSVKVVLNSDNPLEMHELYNISFVKDDKNVQPNGKVEVYVPIPEGMDSSTSKIYRQEADGSWTVLNAKVEGNYLVFETDHFSLYVVVGNKAEIKIASMPQKLTYNVGENIDLTGLSLELNGKVVASGFYCDPAVAYEIGTQVITVNYGGVSAEFEITVTAEKPVITTPSVTTVNYGETLVLSVEEAVLPEGYAVEWIVDGSGFSKAISEDGTECRLTSTANGTATVTVRIVDENGEAVLDGEGNEISDSITLTSKAGFWQKLISFFKNLFRINRIIY